MKNLPCFEIAIKDGKTIGYDKDKFFCRLSVSTSKALDTAKWLNNKGASVLATEFKESYDIIFFSTSNARIINTISAKYDAITVEKYILLDKVRELIRKRQEFIRLEESRQYYYQNDNETIDPQSDRKAFCYTAYYLSHMEKSNNTGWFYD